MSDSPYEPANLESDLDSGDTPPSALVPVLWALTSVNALLAALVLFLEPNVESFLAYNLPGPHMPNAFKHLNQNMPMTMILVATNSALAAKNVMQRRYKMLMPLFAGPGMCFIGWYMTENWDDPSWFHLVALTSLGMLIACAITAVLMSSQNLRRRNK